MLSHRLPHTSHAAAPANPLHHQVANVLLDHHHHRITFSVLATASASVAFVASAVAAVDSTRHSSLSAAAWPSGQPLAQLRIVLSL